MVMERSSVEDNSRGYYHKNADTGRYVGFVTLDKEERRKDTKSTAL